MHRQKWFDNYGEIPLGYQVHHKDGDAFNNEIENYELVKHGEHQSIHAKAKFKNNPDFAIAFQKAGILKAVDWHKSKEGLEWHSLNGKNAWINRATEKKTCIVCNKEYQTPFPTRSKYCHANCKATALRRRRKDA